MGRKRLYQPDALEIGQEIKLPARLAPAARHYAYQWRKKYAPKTFEHYTNAAGKTYIRRTA